MARWIALQRLGDAHAYYELHRPQRAGRHTLAGVRPASLSVPSAFTRHELTAALIGVLHRHGIANAEGAIEVLGPPNYMVRLFGVILSDAVKPILAPQLARATGRLHPTVADVWILTEAESLSSELVQQLFAQILTHHPYASLW